jgi:hypothetical protein
MKNLILCLGILMAFSACDDMSKREGNSNNLSANLVANKKTAEVNAAVIGAPEFKFDVEEHDFGMLEDGEKVTYSFKFENIGDAPLIISNAKGSCGCTVPNWPKDPIAVGEKGTIDVTFNSAGRSGIQSKAITLTANTVPNRKVIRIKSEVISK